MDPRVRKTRRRWAVAGVAVGLLGGVIAGVSSFTGAMPETIGPTPIVLHAAPALVRAGSPVDLTLTTVCEDPADPGCAVSHAAAIVTPAGVAGAAEVPGEAVTGVLRFRIPAELVPDGGFTYSFELQTEAGVRATYPPGGPAAAIRVVTTQGLPVRQLPPIRWDDRAISTGASIRLRPGDGAAQVGFDGAGTEGGISGPSSFAVAPDGSLVVADHVNDRFLWMDVTGRVFDRTPVDALAPVDVAVTAQGVIAVTLGTDAEAIEVTTRGEVIGRYPIGYGVTSRVVGGPVPRVRVGSAQWVPARAAPGQALSAEAQGRSQTATVPLDDGSIGVSEVVDDRLVLAWTRPDGSRAGAAIELPRGVQPGADYFVQPLPDGGALAAQGVWDPTHFGVIAIRLDAAGRISASSLLPEPSTRVAAPFSTVRFAAPDQIWMLRDAGDGMRIDRFRVG